MEKVEIWYNIINCGDGSAAVQWFLTEQDALDEYETQYEPFAEDGVDSVETFVGSDIHKYAIEGSHDFHNREPEDDDEEDEEV